MPIDLILVAEHLLFSFLVLLDLLADESLTPQKAGILDLLDCLLFVYLELLTTRYNIEVVLQSLV